MDWSHRAQRLARIVGNASRANAFPLLHVVHMAEVASARLQAAVTTYLWQTLSKAFPDRAFDLDKRLIVRHARELLALPNRTPNGVILPRRETFQSFNMIHQELADIIDAAGLLPSFSYFQIPCNVRLVDGTLDPETAARSYASTKIHTDVWNGEPISSILFNIPILGDTKAVDLRFFEPTRFPKELQVRLGDYVLGQDVAASVIEYPAAFEIGRIYISDALSLHQTIKRASKLRLSLDFRAIARDLLPEESSDHSESRATYIDPVAWRHCGSTAILASGQPLDAFQKRRAGITLSPEPLSIVNIDEPF